MFSFLKSLFRGPAPVNFISKTAKIGKNTKIWHFSVILDDVRIGDNCNIGSNVECGRGCLIGDNVRIGSGTFLPPHTVIEDNCFLGPHVCMSDDFYPKVNNHNYKAYPPILKKGCSLGAGVTLIPGITIGAGSLVGAGAIVVSNVEPNTILRGEPSRISRERGEK